MNKSVFTALLLAPCLMVAVGFKTPTKVCEGFAPKNNLYIPAGLRDGTGISQADWTALFDKYEKIYAPIFQAHGGTLQLNRLWDDGTVNASADQSGTTWNVNMYGGLARYQGMTKDGMMLVVCHETGHHLGGAPKFGGDAVTGANPSEWAANEGEADYFSALKCAHNMLADEDNISIVAGMKMDPTIMSTCAAQYADAKQAAICQRTAQAGVLLGQILNQLGNGTVVPTIETPVTTAVAATNDDHPEAQCRLDTYFQSSLCTASVSVDLSNDDYHTGSCTAPTSKLGLRPACWFKASDSDHALIGGL